MKYFQTIKEALAVYFQTVKEIFAKYWKVAMSILDIILLVLIVVNIWTGNYQSALILQFVVMTDLLIKVRERLNKNPEVDLRLGSELITSLISTFLKENPDYKLVRREGAEKKLNEDEAGA